MRLASIADIAAAVRGRRLDLGLSQGDLAARAGVSRKWLNEFEAGGRSTAEMGLVLRVLDAVDLRLFGEPVGARPGAGDPAGDDAVDIDLDVLLDDLRRG